MDDDDDILRDLWKPMPKRKRRQTLEICEHGNQKFRCTKCGYTPKKCEHGNNKNKCLRCRLDYKKKRKPKSKSDAPRCKHRNIKKTCTKCGFQPKRCEHGRVSRKCKVCRMAKADCNENDDDTIELIDEPIDAVRDLDDLLETGECVLLDDDE